jgi:hypothetical protein
LRTRLTISGKFQRPSDLLPTLHLLSRDSPLCGMGKKVICQEILQHTHCSMHLSLTRTAVGTGGQLSALFKNSTQIHTRLPPTAGEFLVTGARQLVLPWAGIPLLPSHILIALLPGGDEKWEVLRCSGLSQRLASPSSLPSLLRIATASE